ncbi:dUTP diphosphatase [Solibacillus sp. CAU 1738]|uniref:dUTP diphosphatase n=1 Tax=Solibacillus sp. CAU 1738 TaxID=3140363 RepID=UPI0032607CEB
MEFKQLFEMQHQLDRFIEETQQVTKDVFNEKGLALLVELAELANETRCFKFWSTKGASERNVILEEFVDSIHFLLSLGNMRKYSINEWPTIQQEADLTMAFLRTNSAVGEFVTEPTEERYINVWEQYSIIAYNLGFTVEDIIQAYIEKNEKNYERQRSGY